MASVSARLSRALSAHFRTAVRRRGVDYYRSGRVRIEGGSAVREPSAKLDVLLPRLQDLLEEGHKTLVFSQFTGMLAIVRAHLDRSGVPYEYLDGQTKNREARVWNPAVEAQAIDRAHRLGQSKRVFACRLIARDTIEEKVLELQDGKRALADAIIGADNALIRTLRKEDLELLLS